MKFFEITESIKILTNIAIISESPMKVNYQKFWLDLMKIIFITIHNLHENVLTSENYEGFFFFWIQQIVK